MIQCKARLATCLFTLFMQRYEKTGSQPSPTLYHTSAGIAIGSVLSQVLELVIYILMENCD